MQAPITPPPQITTRMVWIHRLLRQRPESGHCFTQPSDSSSPRPQRSLQRCRWPSPSMRLRDFRPRGQDNKGRSIAGRPARPRSRA